MTKTWFDHDCLIGVAHCGFLKDEALSIRSSCNWLQLHSHNLNMLSWLLDDKDMLFCSCPQSCFLTYCTTSTPFNLHGHGENTILLEQFIQLHWAVSRTPITYSFNCIIIWAQRHARFPPIWACLAFGPLTSAESPLYQSRGHLHFSSSFTSFMTYRRRKEVSAHIQGLSTRILGAVPSLAITLGGSALFEREQSQMCAW